MQKSLLSSGIFRNFAAMIAKCVSRTSYINVTQERASGGREQGARGY